MICPRIGIYLWLQCFCVWLYHLSRICFNYNHSFTCFKYMCWFLQDLETMHTTVYYLWMIILFKLYSVTILIVAESPGIRNFRERGEAGKGVGEAQACTGGTAQTCLTANIFRIHLHVSTPCLSEVVPSFERPHQLLSKAQLSWQARTAINSTGWHNFSWGCRAHSRSSCCSHLQLVRLGHGNFRWCWIHLQTPQLCCVEKSKWLHGNI